MKIKSDFITNSSSTSFIVLFPKKIESIEDVKKYMPLEKAQVVFRDSMDQDPININFKENFEKLEIELSEAIRFVLSSYLDLYSTNSAMEEIEDILKDKCSIPIPISQLEYIASKLKTKVEEHSYGYGSLNEEEIEELIKNNKIGFIYLYHYSDEDSDFFSELEHGKTFDKLPCISISHH